MSAREDTNHEPLLSNENRWVDKLYSVLLIINRLIDDKFMRDKLLFIHARERI